MSKLIGVESTEPADIQNAAYTAMAMLARKCPDIVNKDLQLTVAYFNHLTQAPTELHDSIREALIAIAPAFQWRGDGDGNDGSNSTSNSKDFLPNMNQKLLLAMLSDHAESKSTIVQNVTCTFLTICFPDHFVPARYLLLLIAGERYVFFFSSHTFLCAKISMNFFPFLDRHYGKQSRSTCTESRRRITLIIRIYQRLMMHRLLKLRLSM